MIKNFWIAAAVVILALVYFEVPGQTADAPSKQAKDPKSSGQKPAQQKVEKPASNVTANAAKAFEKVSKELYPKAKQEGNLIVYSVWDVEHIRAITD
ncbi:MAG TPA: hypothetical protein VFK25_01855, partial [Candidatus Binatia bacterium]|nr:hypothetical protein [Candidatus Binatia bacterium]